jgi:hypothetical protein
MTGVGVRDDEKEEPGPRHLEPGQEKKAVEKPTTLKHIVFLELIPHNLTKLSFYT